MDLLVGLLTVASWMIAFVLGLAIICDFIIYARLMTNAERDTYRPFAGWVHLLLMASVAFLIAKYFVA